MNADLEMKKGKKDNENKEVANSLTSNLSNTILLQTVITEVITKIHFEGNEKIIGALLDPCFQGS